MTATAGPALSVTLSPATSSIRIAILAGRDPALRAAGRAVALGACADVVLSIGGERRGSFLERAEAIRAARPDAVLVFADAHEADDAVDLAEAARLSCAARRPAPAVLVAADERTAARIGTSLALTIETFADPRSGAARAALVERLRVVRRAAGGAALRDELIEQAARRIASSSGRSTTVIDVTSGATSVVLARPDGATVAAHAPVGIGATADRVVERGGLDRVRRWIPRAVDAPALLDRVFNRAHWPDAEPATALALSIEMALARECVARVLAEAERASLPVAALRTPEAIVCSGRLAAWRPSQTVLVALDALAPDGVVLVSRELPEAPIVAGGDALETLALAAAFLPRRSASIHVSDGTGAVDEPVTRGAFFLVPTTGAVELTIAGTPTRTAEPLAVGVVADARGRPLELPLRDAERLPTLARWHGALDALPTEGGAT